MRPLIEDEIARARAALERLPSQPLAKKAAARPSLAAAVPPSGQLDPQIVKVVVCVLVEMGLLQLPAAPSPVPHRRRRRARAAA